MNKFVFYPKCAKTFREFYSRDKSLFSKYIMKLKDVRPFDVTLRDGLQGLSKEEQINIKSLDKIKLYFLIQQKYEPANMEIGSVVSNKIFPVFQDSSTIYNHVEYSLLEEEATSKNSILIPNENKNQDYSLLEKEVNPNNFILIPNENKFKDINKFIGLNCFSFITSVSESFQMKNTKMSLTTTFQQINNMIHTLEATSNKHKTKIYVSCINECPLEGKIPLLNIVSELFVLSTMKVDKICLSDTCGTLTKEDFVDIIENTKKVGIDTKLFSLHLHVKPEREEEVQEIVHIALDYGIEEFDVSYLNTGGCSATMNKSELVPNMSYDQYYKFLTNYLLKD
jgi:isopropylmalate/homocitrate/citramalate synthase